MLTSRAGPRHENAWMPVCLNDCSNVCTICMNGWMNEWIVSTSVALRIFSILFLRVPKFHQIGHESQISHEIGHEWVALRIFSILFLRVPKFSTDWTWMNGWMDDWLTDWLNDWMNECMNAWMHECMHAWMNKWMNPVRVPGRCIWWKRGRRRRRWKRLVSEQAWRDKSMMNI